MARRTKEDQIKLKESYDEAIMNIFIRDGWSKVTYDNVAKELGIANKSRLQYHYRSRADFGGALAGKIEPMLKDVLDYSTVKRFEKSWLVEIEKPDSLFLKVVALLVHETTQDNPSHLSTSGFLHFSHNVNLHFGTLDPFHKMLGVTLVYINQQATKPDISF